MRRWIALLLLSAGGGGCLDADGSPPTPVAESFTATYQVKVWHPMPAHDVQVAFGRAVDYIGADGRQATGWEANYDDAGVQGFATPLREILDPGFRVVRSDACELPPEACGAPTAAAWGEARRPLGIGVSAEQPAGAEWRRHGGAWSLHTHGVRYEFADDRLAPTRVWVTRAQGQEVLHAVRTSYQGQGPLPPLPAHAPPTLATHEPGTFLPGAEADPLAVGTTFEAAFQHLRSSQPEAERLIADGACVVQAGVQREREGRGPTEALGPQTTATFSFMLRHNASEFPFRVVWGTTDALAQPSFLGSSAQEPPDHTHGVACASRGPAASLATSFALLDRFLAPAADRASVTWGPFGLAIELHHGASVVQADGTTGLLRLVSTPPLLDIDP